ncbi:MAG TPA: pyrimidine dimer DNA glycosylase/endonuclease V [Gammaproteobacteria bacterium]|nr:pyrimidine dimer DNA glycosylase/endonuclease V [Gammaproteobacteria bacterium]
MRLWTLHPKYLDARGLVSLWREGLLAHQVLQGRTRGYRNHPQLERFRSQPDPIAAVITYLQGIHAEALQRGYAFDPSKLRAAACAPPIIETQGQLNYEWAHLLNKLSCRNPALCNLYQDVDLPDAHPLFHIIPGPVAHWERLSNNRT